VVKKILTKAGTQMAYMTLEDPTGRIEITVFPKTFMQYRAFFEAESVVVVSGKLESRRGDLQLICQSIQGVSLEAMIAKAKEAKLFDPKERISVHAMASLPEEESDEKEVLEPVPDPPDSSPQLPPQDARFTEPLTKPRPPMSATDPLGDEPFVISLSGAQTAPEYLKQLKQLLLDHQGKQVVEIHLPSGGLVKRIKVPFGVKVTPELKTRIAEMAGVT